MVRYRIAAALACVVVLTFCEPARSTKTDQSGLVGHPWPPLWSARELVRNCLLGGIVDDRIESQRHHLSVALLDALATTAAGQDDLLSVLRDANQDARVRWIAGTFRHAGSFRTIPALLEIARDESLPLLNREQALEAIICMMVIGGEIQHWGRPLPKQLDMVTAWLLKYQAEYSDEGYARYWIQRITEYDKAYAISRDYDTAGGVAFSMQMLDKSRESRIVLPFLIDRLRQPPPADVDHKGDRAVVRIALGHVRPVEIAPAQNEPMAEALVRWWDTNGPQALAPDARPALKDLLREGAAIADNTEYIAWANRVRLRSEKSIELPVFDNMGLYIQQYRRTELGKDSGLYWYNDFARGLIRTTGILQAQHRAAFAFELPQPMSRGRTSEDMNGSGVLVAP